MAKFNYKKISYEEHDKLWTKFCKTLALMNGPQEIKNFLKDLLNRSERLMLIRRLLIAELLEDGKTYDEIVDTLKVGKPTIARVERWLNFGRGGYKNAVKKFKKAKHQK